MQWTSLNDLREKYLSFFESKGHLRLPSYPLIPQGDKSLLLINSGMAPMKKFFTGEVTPPRNRVTTCQKCIRTPDLERVGHTARHGTYFEMLGNFSFGDYFKKEAIHWSWEFLTSPEWVGLDPNRLYPSVFEGNETTPADDEAFRIWNEELGVPADHIFRFGKADNLGQELPAPGNGFALEVIAEGEVAQHLEVGTVTGGLADVLDVTGTDALLAGADTAAGRLHLTLEIGLHGSHAGVDQQQGLIILGNQRKAGQTQMLLAFKEGQEHFAQFVYAVRLGIHGNYLQKNITVS